MRPPTAFLGAVLASALLASSGPAWAKEEAAPRTVIVRLAVDRAIPDLTEWRFQANSFLEGTAKTFQSKFGIKLVFELPVRWQPAPGRRALEAHLRDMAAKVPRDGSDIIVGFIDMERVSSASPGIASYINASVLVGNLSDAGAMRYALLHEICHVFGAIDLKEKGSVMSARDPRLDFDPFTTEAVLLHRERRFGPGSFPLPDESLDTAIALYRGRADLGLGEAETSLFLTLFYLEKDDLEAATKVCVDAAERDPDLAGVQGLLGNVCLGRGEPQKAIDHYTKALERQPDDPVLHFNLALAHTELRRYGEAAGHFREALKKNADFVPARLALARLLLAAGSTEAAAAECRKALESEPRSPEALSLLGTAMVALARPFTPDADASQMTELVVPSTIAPGSHEADLAAADAVRYLKMAISIDSTNVQAYVSLGAAFSAQRNYAEAEKAYFEALNHEPKDLNAHFGLGRLYLEEGDMRKAIFHLEQILSIDPGSDLGSRMISGAFRVKGMYPYYRRNSAK